jgi:hypothetical protein
LPKSKIQESLSVSTKILTTIGKFVKHNPVFFTFEILVHLAVIYAGLKELHIIDF